MSDKRTRTGRSEPLFLLILVVATAFAVLVAVDKIAFLSFYQIPVLIAAYYLGRRQGVMIAVAAVLMVALYAAVDPSVFAPMPGRGPGVTIFIWGAFTIVTAYVVGTLYEARATMSGELQTAYSGLVDILAELVDAVDQHAQNHSVRVAKLSARIGVALNLPVSQIEDIRVAGLLHALRGVGVASDALRKAAVAHEAQAEDLPGVGPARRMTGDTGGLLKNVVPLIDAYQERFDGTGPEGMTGDRIPLGARILSVSDALDNLTAAQPYGSGLSIPEALMDIERESGTRFDPVVVDALILATDDPNAR